jgi:hypothetical protein
MGLLIVLLGAPVHGYDLLPDPAGWALVLLGLAAPPVSQRGPLRTLATLSLAVSAVVWFPAARDALNVTDPALAWAASLPELACVVLLTHALAQQALVAADAAARRWLLTARTLTVVVALLPPVVLGGGLGRLDGVAAAVGSLALLLVVVLLFRYAARPWALPAAPRVDVPTP